MRTLVLPLLLNIGNLVVPVGAAEAAVTSAAAMPREKAASWSLAVSWKAMPTAPLPPSKDLNKAYADPGISAAAKAAVATAFDDHAWPSHAVPGAWEDYGPGWEIDGEAVFRLGVDLPESVAGKDLEVCLGAIDDFDETFFNGTSVGMVDKNVLGYWTVERVYRIPGRLVVAGRNVIAVRIFDRIGGGGFIGPRGKMRLQVVSSEN